MLSESIEYDMLVDMFADLFLEILFSHFESLSAVIVYTQVV